MTCARCGVETVKNKSLCKHCKLSLGAIKRGTFGLFNSDAAVRSMRSPEAQRKRAIDRSYGERTEPSLPQVKWLDREMPQ